MALLSLIGSNSGVVQAIYPDDHWSYSTQVTSPEMFQGLIQDEIDAGKTLFVRWIASAG